MVWDAVLEKDLQPCARRLQPDARWRQGVLKATFGSSTALRKYISHHPIFGHHGSRECYQYRGGKRKIVKRTPHSAQLYTKNREVVVRKHQSSLRTLYSVLPTSVQMI
ncbi:hypothetical protein PMIN03_004309 [Paraphaeosphaeria minitans]